jgi:hypothetical protein
MRGMGVRAGVVVGCVVMVLVALGCPSRQKPTLTVAPGIAEVAVGGVAMLSASTSGTNLTEVAWKSSDEAVATVNDSGRVIGISPGEATVTAQLVGTSVRGTAVITVKGDAGFEESLPGDAAEVQATLSRTVSLEKTECNLALPTVASKTFRWGSQRFHKLELPEACYTDEPGKARMPFYSLLFAAPVDPETRQPLQASVTVTPGQERTFENIHVYPAQRPAWEQAPEEDTRTPMFTLDPEFYSSSTPYPEKTLETEIVQIGNLHLLRVKVYPVRYVPSMRRLQLATETSIKVEWPSAASGNEPILLGDFTGSGRAAEAAVAAWPLNRSVAVLADASHLTVALPDRDTVHVADEQFELLVVTRPALWQQAHRLARYRQDQGWRVRLVSLAEATFPDAESIRDYIVTLDEANELHIRVQGRDYALPCMGHLLIFGDSEHIPCFFGMNEELKGNPATQMDEAVSVMGTDLYYAAIRGNDEFPDVTLGRISVDDLAEAEAVVDKIIHYDSMPPEVTPNHMAVYGMFQDNITAQATLSGTADFDNGRVSVYGTGSSFTTEVSPGEYVRPRDARRDDEFAEVNTVESDEHLRLVATWGEADYTGDAELGYRDGRADRPFIDTTERVRRHVQGLGVTVRFAYGKSEGPMPQWFKDGTPLPPELRHPYSWNANAWTVQQNWRQGLDGIILHRDHANWWGWGTPNFQSADIVEMDDPANAIYPFVLSINCRSGSFDNEMDQIMTWAGPMVDAASGMNRESFCEFALRKPNGGAVAIFGAARNSTSGENDELTDGIFKAFYPEYMESDMLYVWGDESIPVIGTACMLGKNYVALRADKPSMARYYLQLYHLFGDPTMELRIPTAHSS